jgi:hypothetical protein
MDVHVDITIHVDVRVPIYIVVPVDVRVVIPVYIVVPVDVWLIDTASRCRSHRAIVPVATATTATALSQGRWNSKKQRKSDCEKWSDVFHLHGS